MRVVGPGVLKLSVENKKVTDVPTDMCKVSLLGRVHNHLTHS